MKFVDTGGGFHRYRHIEVKDKRVSWLHLLDYEMRLGPVVLKTAGIGGVATHYKQRRKGYSRALMEDTHRLLKKEGADVALLFGIKDFYEKFGYAVCTPDVTAKVKTIDLENALVRDKSFQVRALRKADMTDTYELFNHNNTARPITLVRPHGFVEKFRHGSKFGVKIDTFKIVDEKGRFAGYVVLDAAPESINACEVEVKNRAAFGAVLCELVRRAMKRREGEIFFSLAPDHMLISMLRRVGCEVKIEYRHSGGTMARIVDQDSVISKLVKAYGEYRGVAKNARTAQITVETELGKTKVEVPSENGGKGRVSMGSGTLLQVFAGYRKVNEVERAPGVRISGAGREFLDFVSPELEPYCTGPDHF